MNELEEKDGIENMIYEIRGKQVMLDSDLAKLYNCANGTKTINLAVKRHIDRFPEDFYFQLTVEECSRFQFGTLNSRGKNIKYLPHVFTEEGVAMLASVLHTNIAEEVSIKIMRSFVKMRRYIGNNEFRLSNVEAKLLDHDKKLYLLQESFNKFEEKKKINEIYFNGQIYDAYYKIKELFNEAKNELIIIDGYADNSVINIIKTIDVKVIIITKPNNLLTRQDIRNYNMQYNNLKVVYNDTFHDRYFIIDSNILYHCGSSINRIGKKTFSINLINDKEVFNVLLNKVNNIINKKIT